MCNGIVQFFAEIEDIKDSTLDCMASPASKAFNESCPRRLHRPVSLALPIYNAGLLIITQLLTNTLPLLMSRLWL